MPALSPTEVFTPGSFPRHTYVAQRNAEYEERLRSILATSGVLASILGPSKSGKTVLVEKVAGPRAVRIAGAEVESASHLWELVLARVGEPLERTQTTERPTSTVSSQVSPRTTEIQRLPPAGMEGALSALIERDKVLVLDDFHYVDRNVQMVVYQQLKEALQRGVSVVVLAVPHRGDDPIRVNPDLQGRVRHIDVGYWSPADLAVIGRTGFPLVGLSIAMPSVDNLAREALGSPQLMQALCLETCSNREGIAAAAGGEAVLDSTMTRRIARDTSTLVDARAPFDMLRSGPRTHGVKRAVYTLRSGGRGDAYVVVLRALCEEPATATLSYQEISRRVASVVEGAPPTGQQVVNVLTQMDRIAAERMAAGRVLEWDSERQVLNIVDPYFLFYMRWAAWQP